VMIAEGAALWRAAARPRDLIPAVRHLLAGLSCPRIAVDDRAPRRKRRKIDVPASGGRQRDGGHRHADEVVASPIVDGARQIGRKDVGIDHDGLIAVRGSLSQPPRQGKN
jgi:hypothetical protein